jgi:hypothetical protein
MLRSPLKPGTGFKPRAHRMGRGTKGLARSPFQTEPKERPKRTYGGLDRGTALKAKPYHPVKRKCGLRDALDREVSLTVRTNNPACVLCGESDWQKLTCGHLFKRTHEATRFDTEEGGNCSTLCKSCNDRDNREHHHYAEWFKARHGQKAYEALEARARSKKSLEPYELRAMLDGLRARQREAA